MEELDAQRDLKSAFAQNRYLTVVSPQQLKMIQKLHTDWFNFTRAITQRQLTNCKSHQSKVPSKKRKTCANYKFFNLVESVLISDIRVIITK